MVRFRSLHPTDRPFEDDPSSVDFWSEDFDASRLSGVDLAICESLLDRERNEMCAGLLLEDAARASTAARFSPRRFDAATQSCGLRANLDGDGGAANWRRVGVDPQKQLRTKSA